LATTVAFIELSTLCEMSPLTDEFVTKNCSETFFYLYSLPACLSVWLLFMFMGLVAWFK